MYPGTPIVLQQPDDPNEIGVMGKYLRKESGTYEESLFRRIFNTLIGSEITVTQEVKFADVSFYQGAINWDVYKTQTIAVIIRAGQNLWIDTQFTRNWSEAKRVGLKRGVYYFYDDRVSPQRQADILIALIKNDLPELEVVADWENSYGGPYGGLSNVIIFLARIKAALPSVKLAIYTGYYWFKDHSSAGADYNYIVNQDVKLWLAWYTSNPSYVQIPAPWTRLTHWQFGTPAIGSQWGVGTTEIDMNWFNGTRAEFDARYGGSAPPPTPPTEELVTAQVYFDGGTYSQWIAHLPVGDVKYHIFAVEVSKVDTFYVNAPRYASGRSYIPNMMNEYGLDFAINGDGFVGVDPQGISTSEGRDYPARPNMYEETVYYARDKTISFSRPAARWMAMSCPNVLVVTGVKRPICATRVDRDPRTASGWSADGKIYAFLKSDGREYANHGFNYNDVADRLIHILGPGANIIMHDGGGSSNMGVRDRGTPIILDVPCGENPMHREGNGNYTFVNMSDPNHPAVDAWMRPVANILGIKAKGGLPTMYRYNAVSPTKAMSLRKDHSTASASITSYPINTVVYGNDLFTAPADLYTSANVLYQKKGDVWLHVLEINGTAVDGWMAVIHLGTKLMVLTDTQQGQNLVPFTFTISVQGFKPFTVNGNLEKL